MLTVELSESVQLTTHFSININDFFSSTNAITNFINNLAALLQITDTSRIKVVGVHSGSTTIVTSVTNPVSGSTDPLTAPQIIAAANTPAFSSGLNTVGLGNLLGYSATYQPLVDTTTEKSSTSTGLIVGVAMAGVIIVVGVIITVICCMRRRAKVVEGVVTN